MPKILIWKNIIHKGEYDLYNIPNKQELFEIVDKHYNGEIYNVGNKLWLQGIVSELTDGENELTFLNSVDKDNAELINEQFDAIVLPMANIFNPHFAHYLKPMANKFKNIKIPTFVISCGIQANGCNSIDDLISIIRSDSIEFIKAIYNTGGEFCLRGYNTKEFFNKLGFKTARVIGCPSLFQLGPNLKIEKPPIEPSELKPVFNGNIPNNGIWDLFWDYSNSMYVDQDEFFSILRDSEAISNQKELYRLLRKYGYDRVNQALTNRVKIFNDISTWRNYLINNNYNFSYGSRIHGNIVSLLSGIPALIYAGDLRVSEMADYYNIPVERDPHTSLSLYEKYDLLDYSEFNKSYTDKYNTFVSTLKEFQLIKEHHYSNEFISPISHSIEFDFSVGQNLINKNKAFYKCYNNLYKFIKH